MKKRVLAGLLSFALLFGVWTDGIGATERAAGNDIGTEVYTQEEEELSEDLPQETEEPEASAKAGEEYDLPDEAEGAEVSAKAGKDRSESVPPPTGFRKPIWYDLEPEDITEIYDKSETDTLQKGSQQYRTIWDTYSTNYYYNMLAPSEKNLWDKLDDMCYGYLMGTETLTKKDSYYDETSGKTTYFFDTKAVPYEAGMSKARADDVMTLFYFSNPQYYFLEAFMGGGFGYVQMTVNTSFANGASRQAATRMIESEIRSWLAEINQEETDWAKEKKIHDMICEKVIYDPDYQTVNANPYSQTIYSVFCTPSTVCAGYSQTMQLLCNAVGIDCCVVTSEEHEWNIVRLNGAWYYVDCTWNDEDDGYVYDYFNRSEEFFKSEPWAYVKQHTPEAIWYGMLPPLTYDSGAWDLDPGTIHEAQGEAAAPVIYCPGSVVTITAPAGGTIYYTVNGGEPSCAFTKATRYRGPFPLYGNSTVRAMVVLNGYRDSSSVASTITPLYRITFLANGGYIGSTNTTSLSRSGLLYYTNVGQLPVPKRSGYVFDGWYTDPYGGSKISAAVKITADSNYYARWTKISPKKATLSSVKNKKKRSVRVKIKNISIAGGYQIRYSTKKNMKKSKNREVSGTAYTIQKLKKGKTYYIQARMYQIDSVSGQKKYGAWSEAKSVKIKK